MSEYPDARMGPLGPQDKRFPMPGMVGVNVVAKVASTPPPPQVYPDVLTTMLPHERQAAILHQYLTVSQEVNNSRGVGVGYFGF